MDKILMKRKKLIVAVILSIITFALCSNQQNYDDENDFIVAIHGKTAEIIGYKGTSTKVNIPPRIGKIPVTVIGQEAFDSSSLGNEKLFTSVKIPKGVAVIGEKAFRWNNLTEIIIPNTVVSIGDDAFAFNKLTSVNIPNSVKHIGIRAFWSNLINRVIIPGTVTEIGESVFKDNELTSITIPESVVTIGDRAFENNRFTELIIPKNVTSIDRNAFSYSRHANGIYDNRNNITKVTIGDNVEVGIGAIRRFAYFYEWAVSKKGGTYIYSDHYWRPEDKSIPVYSFEPDDGWKSPDIKFLLDMPDLENVRLHNNDLLTDIMPLSELTKIKSLTIYKCPNVKNINPLSSLVNLEALYLTHNNNYDYRDIASLQKLKSLIIVGDHLGEIDLSSIGQLHYVKFLTLTNGFAVTKIKNINELQNLKNLETLHISGVDNLDLSWVSNMYNLTKLDLDSCTVNDLSPLVNLPNLAEVDLIFSSIKDITCLSSSNSIKHVRVFEHDVEAGIDSNIRSRFHKKGIDLDTSYDDR
ncbi:MAG: leucine-rich repeat protein [Spirochaetaceae bacterium]|jgi:Leucine-rich repeat (LRR) protein|nr:leucine-rich repeat protein [Spirochaetaceae bacterium]